MMSRDDRRIRPPFDRDPNMGNRNAMSAIGSLSWSIGTAKAVPRSMAVV